MQITINNIWNIFYIFKFNLDIIIIFIYLCLFTQYDIEVMFIIIDRIFKVFLNQI